MARSLLWDYGTRSTWTLLSTSPYGPRQRRKPSRKPQPIRNCALGPDSIRPIQHIEWSYSLEMKFKELKFSLLYQIPVDCAVEGKVSRYRTSKHQVYFAFHRVLSMVGFGRNRIKYCNTMGGLVEKAWNGRQTIIEEEEECGKRTRQLVINGWWQSLLLGSFWRNCILKSSTWYSNHSERLNEYFQLTEAAINIFVWRVYTRRVENRWLDYRLWYHRGLVEGNNDSSVIDFVQWLKILTLKGTVTINNRMSYLTLVPGLDRHYLP